MGDTMYFLSCDLQRADELAEPYRAKGWTVFSASPTEESTAADMVENKPLAAVFCLDSSDGDVVRSLIEEVADHRGEINPILVFYGGSAEEVSRIREVAPFGLFVNPDEVQWVLKHLSFKA